MAHWISHFLCVHLCCGTQSLCIASLISRVAAAGHYIRHFAPHLQLNSYWELLSHRKQLLEVVHRCRRWWSLNLQSLQSQWGHPLPICSDGIICSCKSRTCIFAKVRMQLLSCFHWYNSFHFLAVPLIAVEQSASYCDVFPLFSNILFLWIHEYNNKEEKKCHSLFPH